MNAELNSWICHSEEERERKAEREFCRYPKLIEEMGLYLIRTDNKIVLDIGCGPRGILSCLEARLKIGLDPLIDEYKKYYDLTFLDVTKKGVGEKIPFTNDSFDLVTSVNSLDHCSNPIKVVNEIRRVLKPSGYFGVHFCLDLAKNNPHPSHSLNISKKKFHDMIDSDFETVHEKEVKYGWVKHQGKVGEPALAGLFRLTTKGA